MTAQIINLANGSRLRMVSGARALMMSLTTSLRAAKFDATVTRSDMQELEAMAVELKELSDKVALIEDRMRIVFKTKPREYR